MKQTVTVSVAALLLLAACARVYVAPAVDLKPHATIGIIEFNCSTKGSLGQLTTRKFMEAITADQTDVGIVELGDEATVLAAVHQPGLGPEAMQAIGEKYDVQSVFTGSVTISDVTPSLYIGPGLAFASFEAKVNATLIARLVSTSNSATVWTNSGTDQRTVGGVSKIGSAFSFDAKDPEQAYGELVSSLTRKVTRDFRHSWRHKCCGR